MNELVERAYQQCTRCVMDTSDPEIAFNQAGECNHCTDFTESVRAHWFPNAKGEQKLQSIIEQIKQAGKDQDYDCILGLSGGVDSSYLALKVREYGLRPLVVHVDAGWNSELAVANIEAIVKYCSYDLHTHVVDWEEMRDLQLSYLRSGIANQDVPQDHIFFATLYHFAAQNGIRYILSGGNYATEGIFPESWHGSAMDSINLKGIHKKYGAHPLKHYKTLSFFEYYIWYPLVKKMQTIRPLDFMAYDKPMALKELEERVNYKPYARKHGESQFTKLFQNYYLPTKFGYDKRRPHLSSMIVTGQITREEAIAELEKPLYTTEELESDIVYFCKKVGISRVQFDQYMAQKNRSYNDYPTWNGRYEALRYVYRTIIKLTGKRIKFNM